MNTEWLGIVGSVVGLATAVVNRKRIMVYRFEDGSSSSGSGRGGFGSALARRARKLVLFLVLAVVCAVIVGYAASENNEDLAQFMAFAVLICGAIAMYQFVAVFLMIAWRLVR